VVDAGLLSADAAKAMREANLHYVPFFRFMDEVITSPQPGQTLANVASGIKPIKGGPGKIVDPLENIVKNTYALVNIADRHAVADALIRLAETVPDQQIVRRVPAPPPTRTTAIDLRRQLTEAGVEVPPEVAQNMADAFRSPKEGTVWAIRQGERQYFEVDPPLYRALLQLDRESQNTLVKLLSVPASLQRAGFTTFNPVLPSATRCGTSFRRRCSRDSGSSRGMTCCVGSFMCLARMTSTLSSSEVAESTPLSRAL
jgi:hypothetical protein